MTTLTIRSNDAQARQFVKFAQTLPFVEVEEKKVPDSIYDFKPEVRDDLLDSERGEGLIRYGSLDEMFRKLGI